MAISPSTSQASNSAAISVDLTEAFQLVVLSKSFFNWKEVEDAVNELQKVTHTHYVHVKSKEAGDSCFKYTFVVFKCTFGVNRKPQGIGLIKKPSKFRDCPSMFRFALNDNKYTVRSYRMIHNHPCTQSFMTCDAWSRRLTEEEKEYLKPILQQSSSTDEVIQYVRNELNKLVTAKDVQNMKLKSRKIVGHGLKQKGKLKVFSEKDNSQELSSMCFWR